MSKSNRKQEQQVTVESVQTATADLSMVGQLTAQATVTPPAPVVRHYGGTGAGKIKTGAQAYALSPAGAKRIATQAAKRDLDSRYACAAELANLLSQGNVTADQYMQACEKAGCADAGKLAFSKKASTANAAEVWRYYVAKKLLVPV